MKVRAAAAVLAAVLAAGWGTSAWSEGQKQSEVPERVKNAPMTVTIAGSRVTLEAHVWVNLLPGPKVRSDVVRIAARLLVLGQRADISVARLWLVSQTGEPVEASVLSSQLTQEGVRASATVASPRDLVAKTWVVAEIRYPAGTLLIRSPETAIQQAR